jgi:hypothetical protein
MNRPNQEAKMDRREFLRYTAASTTGLLLGSNVGCARPLGGAATSDDSLAGAWRFRLDRNDAGVAEQWFSRALPQRIDLPGSLQEQGFGDEVTVETKWTGTLYDQDWYKRPEYQEYTVPGNIKLPFWLQPERHYVGVAWYEREIEIPTGWEGRRVVLFLERPHWETTVWVDGRRVGSNNSLSTPHVHDLGTGLAPGAHRLSIRIDNCVHVPVGLNAHSISDNTQTNWNGIVGRIELLSTSPVWLDDVQVRPDVDGRKAVVAVRIGNATGGPGSGTLRVGDREQPISWGETGGQAEVEIGLGQTMESWDEFNPALQRLSVELSGGAAADRRVVTFGLRHVGTQGTQFTVNGRKTYIRGTLDCCIFPLTGYPPTDVESWARIIRICKSHGLNTIRFHSWCPPEAAFTAADELGFYLQPECAVWAREVRLGTGSPLDSWLYEEADRILAAYGNHPSFMMLTHGNEPGGGTPQATYLNAWVAHYKKKDPRRLYAGASNQCHVPEDELIVDVSAGGKRVRGSQAWKGGDYREGVAASAVPVVAHEVGQYCVYPNFDQIAKYPGNLKPNNFRIFRDSLTEAGMLDQAEAFVAASGKLQVLCYKEDIEASLRTGGMGGFHLLGLQDFTGQCTAVIGVLDAFWDGKGYVAPEEWRRFSGATVPLARITKYEWTTDETFTTDVEIAHFGPAPLPQGKPVWRLTNEAGQVVARGALPERTIPVDNGVSLGRISVDLREMRAPAAYRLDVGLDGTPFENSWWIWLYPARVDTAPAPEVLVTTKLDEAARVRLGEGGRVLLIPRAEELAARHPKGAFLPVFWNTAMWRALGRVPEDQTLGLLIDPAHPALRAFPTRSHSEWQWADVADRSRALIMNDLPQRLRPIVQVIDDWNQNRRLGLVFEARVGAGKLLVCSSDLRTDLENRPAARQLLRSLLDYAAGEQFQPATAVDFETISRQLWG